MRHSISFRIYLFQCSGNVLIPLSSNLHLIRPAKYLLYNNNFKLVKKRFSLPNAGQNRTQEIGKEECVITGTIRYSMDSGNSYKYIMS